jgi:hypothetical protein
MASDRELKFQIINEIGIISIKSGEWKKEVNRISWDGKEPKYDIRDWSPNHTKMGKGITLTEEELRTLKDILIKEVEFIDKQNK